MERRVAVIGVGWSGFAPQTADVSYKELMFEAATRAYDDAGVDPRRDVDSFITCAEDYWEGFSIFDEFVPDQLGAVLKPTCTVSGDGLHGLVNAVMQIESGLFDVVVVEAHSKASDILTYEGLLKFAMDPIFTRPLGWHPYALAGLEMARYLYDTGNTEEHCAMVVEKNRRNALANSLASYAADLTADDVMDSRPLFEPLKELDVAGLADGCVVMVLAAEEVAEKLADKPVWVLGMGWANETISPELRDWCRPVYAEIAADMAYAMAGIKNPAKEIDLLEVDDRFSYKELQHVEALGVCDYGEASRLLEDGVFDRDGDLPVNPSGGSLGVGNLLEASGLFRAMEVVLQLRGEAGRRQVQDVEVGVAQSWRGLPTASGAVVIFGSEKEVKKP
ncbi:acetyl-CoA acetyltransferase [Candidatus Bathyarchaeota archaeon ex4484_135]|nr:MAG: acetyl-CoA acetyltransferase [Candidatus Bathyarchaeota archaeon ex4484_135]